MANHCVSRRHTIEGSHKLVRSTCLLLIEEEEGLLSLDDEISIKNTCIYLYHFINIEKSFSASNHTVLIEAVEGQIIACAIVIKFGSVFHTIIVVWRKSKASVNLEASQDDLRSLEQLNRCFIVSSSDDL